MKQLVVVGLGNAGERFSGTRHNVGIEVVRAWVAAHQDTLIHDWREEARFAADLAELTLDGRHVIAFFPLTMMNDSGRAVAAYCLYEKLMPAELVMVHDDLELGLGEIKPVDGGSARGHNGVRSVQAALDTDQIKRLRLGIGRPSTEVPIEQFVLARFTLAERAAHEELLEEGQAHLERLVRELLRVSTEDN